MELQLIRNATLKVTFADTTFLIDPYFADKHSQPSFGGKSNNPTVDLPMNISKILQDVDFIVISHLHPDHFDNKAQQLISRQIPIYCQPEDEHVIREQGFHNVIPVITSCSRNELRITRTPCQHGSGKILSLMGIASGFVFQHSEEPTLYWCGDTIWYAEVKKMIDQFHPSFIVCHAGANRFFKGCNLFGVAFQEDSDPLIMDAHQVVELCQYAQASKVIATHMEALDHETLTRRELRQVAHNNQIENDRLIIPEDGEKLVFK